MGHNKRYSTIEDNVIGDQFAKALASGDTMDHVDRVVAKMIGRTQLAVQQRRNILGYVTKKNHGNTRIANVMIPGLCPSRLPPAPDLHIRFSLKHSRLDALLEFLKEDESITISKD